MSPDVVLPLFLALPLAAASVGMMLSSVPWLQRALTIGTLSATLVMSLWVLDHVSGGLVVTAFMGAREPTIGIVLAADPTAAVMLLVASVLLLAVLVYAVGSSSSSELVRFFHPAYLVLAAGVYGSFLTADLFNLFVSFEVMLTASYVLMTMGGSIRQVRHGMTYVVIGLVASALFLTAIGLVYAATGTVNFGEIAIRMESIDPNLRHAIGLLLLVVFGVKAAVFPVFQWLPDSYPTTPSPVTALFAGLLTKVGVYAIIRTQTVFFPGDQSTGTIILVIAGLTMIVGALGAIAQDDIKRILSFHIVSQIGYMIFGLGLFTVAGVAGAVFYAGHHILVKTTLFLVDGLVEEATGTGQLRRLGGLRHHVPLVSALFLISALSLAGIPPFSGFLAKLGLIQAGMEASHWTIVGVALFTSILTLFSMTKIWAGAFWGAPSETTVIKDADGQPRRLPRLMTGATVAMVAASIAYTAFAGPLYQLSVEGARILIDDPAQYIDAVAGR